MLCLVRCFLSFLSLIGQMFCSQPIAVPVKLVKMLVFICSMFKFNLYVYYFTLYKYIANIFQILSDSFVAVIQLLNYTSITTVRRPPMFTLLGGGGAGY